jgi:hypothetical protein
VRVWDLGTGSPMSHPLAVAGPVIGLCVADRRDGLRVVLGGAGVACVEPRIRSMGEAEVYRVRASRDEEGDVDG